MRFFFIPALLAASIAAADAAPVTVPMHLIDSSGATRSIGEVVVTETAFGLVFTRASTVFTSTRTRAARRGCATASPWRAWRPALTSTPLEANATAPPGATATWATCPGWWWRPTGMPAMPCWLRGSSWATCVRGR